ncbi:type IV pilus biogenesis protein CpaD/CtpE [Sphingomonas vulcanisoli]|uniref:Type IV pilus biogenesis protein CpaD/CtpE n=1 Tax=Sphingomonas vulcanisoli TaxID=1658060 RepID=A0ABX0TN93_9SPHN|nr:CpaD family pilus assembly lipoprotein [Sphingomonas vulcanisoli]NIJ06998.1 type IV pilus biogenesis protein CpaD/CtpE [Sphingomonas vulcanisoli]
MRLPYRFAIMMPLIALSACSAGERGMNSPHQPLVSPQAATVPNCPDWSDKDRPTTDAQAANYGCATAVNLAAMIADPTDLLHGKNENGSRVEVSVRAIRSWRKVAPTIEAGIEKVSSKGGN